MPAHCVYVTRSIPIPVVNAARHRFRMEVSVDGNGADTKTLISKSQISDALVVSPGDCLDSEVIKAIGRRTRAIATFSAGHDRIDIGAARDRGIVVTNVPALSDHATAEITMLLALNVSRRAVEAEELLNSGRWTGWAPDQLLASGLHGRRLGIVGMGSIGQQVARLAQAFGMEVHYHNRQRLDRTNERGARYHPDLRSLLEVSDVLSLHCPLTAATRGLIGRSELRRLPHGAIVINTSRGDVLDEEALISALNNGIVAGAGPDVFHNEPNAWRDLVHHPRVVGLPHVGSATHATRVKMGLRVLKNLDAVLSGTKPPDLVA